MRIYTASLCTETNSFSPLLTDLSCFEEGALLTPGTAPAAPNEFSALLAACREAAADRPALTVIEGTVAYAYPSGPTTRHAYETLRDRLLDELVAALPVDIVALQLHGAMIADGYPDCEADLLTRVRALVGDTAIIGVLFDPHAHFSVAMARCCDIPIAFKEYPHSDFLPRARELVALLQAAADGAIRPRPVVVDCGMIGIFHTDKPVVRALVERMQALEAQAGLLSVSLVHGFPWGDVPDMGTRVIVVTDDDETAGATAAHALALAVRQAREEAQAPAVPLAEALAIAAAGDGLWVLADSPDNPGGGAAGDSTYVLQALLQASPGRCCLGPLWDPIAVAMAFRAGVGGRCPLRIGGKAGRLSGPPLDVEAEVLALDAAATQSFAGSVLPLGRAAAIAVGEVAIVLVERRAQALGPDLFTNLGIDVAACKLIVVKSSQHFRHGFATLATGGILVLDCPGALQAPLEAGHYHHLRRPLWPFDADCPPPQRLF